MNVSFEVRGDPIKRIKGGGHRHHPAAMVNTELYSVMKDVAAKSPDPRGLDVPGKIFFTPMRNMFARPACIQMLEDMAAAAYVYAQQVTLTIDKTLLDWHDRQCAAMEMLVQYCPLPRYMSVAEAPSESVQSGDAEWTYLKLNTNKYGIKTTVFDTQNIMNAAVKGGNWLLVEGLILTGLSVNVSHAELAIREYLPGREIEDMLDVITRELPDRENDRWGYRLLNAAAWYGHANIITCLLESRSCVDDIEKAISDFDRRWLGVDGVHPADASDIVLAALPDTGRRLGTPRSQNTIDNHRSLECLKALFADNTNAQRFISDRLRGHQWNHILDEAAFCDTADAIDFLFNVYVKRFSSGPADVFNLLDSIMETPMSLVWAEQKRQML
eukprot:COSAG01_NODE_725_length_14049_cov_7.712760_8_plen_385_part_00